MFSNWCLRCEKQLIDDADVYCSAQCRLVDIASSTPTVPTVLTHFPSNRSEFLATDDTVPSEDMITPGSSTAGSSPTDSLSSDSKNQWLSQSMDFSSMPTSGIAFDANHSPLDQFSVMMIGPKRRRRLQSCDFGKVVADCNLGQSNSVQSPLLSSPKITRQDCMVNTLPAMRKPRSQQDTPSSQIPHRGSCNSMTLDITPAQPKVLWLWPDDGASTR